MTDSTNNLKKKKMFAKDPIKSNSLDKSTYTFDENTKRTEEFKKIINELVNANCSTQENIDDFSLCEQCQITEQQGNCPKDKLITMLGDYLDKYHRIPYSYLFLKFTDYDDEKFDLDVVTTRLFTLSNYLYNKKDRTEKDNNIAENLLRIFDNIDLASKQNSVLQKKSNNINENLNEKLLGTKNDIDDLMKIVDQSKIELKNEQERIQDAEKRIQDTEDRTKDNEKNLVSIVAIFVGISFVMFGGMSLLNGLFNFKGMNHIPIIELLCLGSLFGLIIIYTTYLFMKFILNITEKNQDDKTLFPDSKQVNKATEFIRRIFICTIIVWVLFTGFRILTNDNSEFDIGKYHFDISILENNPVCE